MNFTSKSRRTTAKWIATASVIAGLSAWFFGLETKTTGSRQSSQTPERAIGVTRTAPVTDADADLLAEGPRGLANDESAEMAESPPVPLDPNLIPSREEEIQHQLQTQTFEGEQLNQIAAIARKTENRKTRLLALDALADSEDAHAQKLMTELYRDPKFDNESREHILGSLRPTSAKDDVAGFLLEEIRNEKNSEGTKLQALAPLVVMNLMNEHSKPDPDILAKLPPNTRKRYLEIYRVMLSGENPDVPASWSKEGSGSSRSPQEP